LKEIIMKSTTRKTLLLVGLLAATLGAASIEAAPGRYRFNQDNTPGWSLMTPAERSAHQNKMWSAKTYDECKAIQTEHHAVIAARAKDKGITLNVPSQNACDRMQMRGVLK
jgi:hypothetical protein